MTKTQKTLLLLLLTCLLLSLTACGSTNSSTSQQASTPGPNCYDEKSQIGQSISDKFDAPYDQVMGWFCAGHTYDDILLALQTSQLVDGATADDLLQRKAGGQSWDQIWADFGLTQ
jgi:hypothetical protein